MSAMRALLIVSMSTGAIAAAQESPPAPGVCAQLAAQTGLQRQRDGSWRANLLGGVGAALFGGTTGATFLVEPVTDSTPEQHLEKACAQAGAEIACSVTGPARITVGTKRGNAVAELAPGKTAQLGMKGRYLTCRESV